MERLQPLSANSRNLVKKIGDGGTLAEAEREMIERYRSTNVSPEELDEAHDAAILRKYARGGRLTKEQQRRIEPRILPVAAPLVKRQTSDRYKHSLSHYTTIYGRDVRNIKRWLKTGREHEPPDYPPLDEPQLMAAWWRRCRERRVPPEMEAIEAAPPPPSTSVDSESSATRAPRGSSSGATGAAAPPPPSDSQSPLSPMQIDLASGVSADLGLQQAQALVSATFKQMEKAIAAGRHTEAGQLRREWQQLVQILRAWEKDITKIQEGRGEVLRTREINTELIRIFTTIGQSFLNALLKLIADLAPALPADQQRLLAQSRRDEIFLHLKGTRFERTWTSLN